jgi:DNA transposition AAA+ family ATPase
MEELLIVDESGRLSTTGLEQLRDLFDRRGFGLIFIGMPATERRLARYPQLDSRVGFGPSLQVAERRGLDLDAADFLDATAAAAIARITGDSFRLIHRLFVQIDRITRINELRAITVEIAEAARSTLVIGAT